MTPPPPSVKNASRFLHAPYSIEGHILLFKPLKCILCVDARKQCKLLFYYGRRGVILRLALGDGGSGRGVV